MVDGLLMIAGGAAAGLFGSLLGLGGGILIVPLLTLAFGLDLREAVGVSLVAVIVTSGASAGVYLQRHVANLRLGMTLELFTAIGALVGGLVAFLLSDRVLAGLFAVLLVYAAAAMVRRGTPVEAAPPDDLDEPDASAPAMPLGLTLGGPGYPVRRLGLGAVGSVGAGVVSALLGIGGGLVKVPVMHLVMGVPLRVATATSNLMIGVTASASAVIYLLRGEIDPFVAGPTAIGVFLGASLGSRTAHRLDLRVLRILFVVVLLYTAVQMVRRAVGG
ncbi:MAG TPA: sulfite exporter TauE/SafE family protein [Candidatus Limnocylindrales bacterium]|nr:sulfite exporter TauE/SafE family protein [Candidatus Limnocylindrales bacterium]